MARAVGHAAYLLNKMQQARSGGIKVGREKGFELMSIQRVGRQVLAIKRHRVLNRLSECLTDQRSTLVRLTGDSN